MVTESSTAQVTAPDLPRVNILDLPPTVGETSLRLDPRTYERALGCVHCGLCLPVCPTYLQTGHEAESPRGRIQLMRGLSDGAISPTASVRQHLDLCLDCRACETACPSGVVYHELIEEMRARLAHHAAQLPAAENGAADVDQRRDPILRWMVFHILTSPLRLKLAMLLLRLMQRTGIYNLLRRLRVFELLPAGWQKMLQMIPEAGPLWPRAVPDQNPAGGPDSLLTSLRTTAKVGLLTGCVGSVVLGPTNRQAIELLNACGLDVYAPSRQRCCGAMHHHSGEIDRAREMARRNIDLFLPKSGKQCDFITTNIAGCGAMLKEYGVLLRDDPDYCLRAREFSRRVRDITELLAQQNLPPLRFPVNVTAAYHDACHLAHAQKVTAPPRELLARIPGLTLVPLAEHDFCCGAAGIYNLVHPKMAGELADRKLRNFAAAGAEILIAGNVGCAMHLQSQAAQQGGNLRVVHPVTLLHQAMFGDAAENSHRV